MNTGTTLDQSEWAQQSLTWRISLTPIHSLAFLASIYRISRRYKTHQWGLDDYAATSALICDLFFFPTLWLRKGHTALVPGASILPLPMQTHIAQTVIGWIVQIAYPLLTWSAKISLALSLARFIPPFYRTHSATIIVIYLSAFICIGILIQTCISCSRVDEIWTHVSPFGCGVTAAAGIVRLSCQIVIDICLTLIPFRAFFWPLSFSITPPVPNPAPNHPNNNYPTSPVRLSLPLLTRCLIKICFTASLITISTAITTMVLLFRSQESKYLETIARTEYLAFVLSHLTGSSCLLVCNLLIVVMSFYRFLRTQLEHPTVTESAKSFVLVGPDPSNQVNSGSEPINGSNNAASGAGERGRVAVSSNMSEKTASGGDESGAGRLTSESSTICTVEFTELFETDFSITDPTRHSQKKLMSQMVGYIRF